jgi:D-lactate dehydrogenase (cytochrome)
VPEGGIVISMSKMSKVLEINIKEKYAVVQPAVLLRDLQEMLVVKNLFYPPDPTEQDSFIGANIATNASGAKSFKYGVTRNYVLELRIVLPNGELIELKRGKIFAINNQISLQTANGEQIILDIPKYSMPKTKHAAGYFAEDKMDAIDLFIGSEGTLGVITEAKLKLLNAPQNLISGIVFFRDEDKAFGFVNDARSESIKNRNSEDFTKINARGLEFFDYFSLQLLKDDYTQIKNEHKVAIWFEQELEPTIENDLLENWLTLLEKHSADIESSWFASDKKDSARFKEFRHAVSARVSDYIASKGIKKIGTDTAVPVENFKTFYEEMKNSVKEHSINYVCYGHIGDCHLHLNMLPVNQTEFEKAKKLYRSFCKRAIELGGTISAEHGVGKMKRDYLLDMYGEKNIIQMAELKKQLDPNKILGIGNIFEEKYLYDK